MTDPRIEAAAQWLYDWSVEDRGLNPGIHTWPPPGEWPDTWRKVARRLLAAIDAANEREHTMSTQLRRQGDIKLAGEG